MIIMMIQMILLMMISRYLLGKAESLQGKFEGLYPSLLRLASAQFPHLCLVSDWLTAEQSQGLSLSVSQPRLPEAGHLKVMSTYRDQSHKKRQKICGISLLKHDVKFSFLTLFFVTFTPMARSDF